MVGLRVGTGSVDLSVSDVALVVAFWPAVFLGGRPYSAPMRSLLWLSALYQAATLFTVVANPFVANAVEWVHAWFLVGGALVVGWAVGRAGYARQGLTLLLLASAVLAAGTVVQGLQQYAGGDVGPVSPTWPFAMHKNFVGTVLGFAAVVAYARPAWARWSRTFALTVFWLCAAAVVVAQSRQGIIGLGVALLVIAFRSDAVQRRSRIIVLAVVPAAVFVATLIRDEVLEGSQHSPIFTRLAWYEHAVDLWLGSPAVGAGLRYWREEATLGIQPPNAEIELLASAGVLGLAGFLVLLVGALVVLWRVDPRYGTLAFTVVLTRLVQAQFDLFWVTVQVSVPFVVVGICLGVQAFEAEGRRLDRAPGAVEQRADSHARAPSAGPVRLTQPDHP